MVVSTVHRGAPLGGHVLRTGQKLFSDDAGRGTSHFHSLWVYSVAKADSDLYLSFALSLFNLVDLFAFAMVTTYYMLTECLYSEQ